MLETASGACSYVLQMGSVCYTDKTTLDLCERESKRDAATKKQKDEMNLVRAASFLQKLSAGPRVGNQLESSQGRYICNATCIRKFLDFFFVNIEDDIQLSACVVHHGFKGSRHPTTTFKKASRQLEPIGTSDKHQVA